MSNSISKRPSPLEAQLIAAQARLAAGTAEAGGVDRWPCTG